MALTKVTGQVIKNTTDVTVGVLTVTNTLAVGGTVSIGGTLTYEDVTNVDAVGLITARNGIVVGSGITLSKDGDVFFTGIATGNGSGLTAINASTVTVADVSSDTSCFVLYTTAATGDLQPKSGSNLTFNSVTGQLTATKFAGDGSDLTGVAAGKFVSDGIGITTNTPVGIETTSLARKDLAGPAGNTATGAGSSFHGAYMGDGFLSFNTEFSNSSGYYISTFTNALVAGPMQLGTTLTIDGNFTIV